MAGICPRGLESWNIAPDFEMRRAGRHVMRLLSPLLVRQVGPLVANALSISALRGLSAFRSSVSTRERGGR